MPEESDEFDKLVDLATQVGEKLVEVSELSSSEELPGEEGSVPLEPEKAEVLMAAMMQTDYEFESVEGRDIDRLSGKVALDKIKQDIQDTHEEIEKD